MASLLAHFQVKAAERLDWMKEVEGFGDWKEIKHIILILIANEPKETYERTLEALAKQTFLLKNIVPVLATEERYPDGEKNCKELRAKWKDVFGEILITVHPKDIVGEIKGKSSNENWAAREAKRILVDEKGWNIKNITITSNDADSILHRQYLACLTYKFLDNPHRYERFWQPAVVFYNNIWRLPAATRVVNVIGSVLQIGLLARRDRLVNFSNYTSSLSMIDQIGYWDTDVIPEDYRIFFKAFFKLQGRVEVEPVFLASSADAAESTTTWKTLVNDYQQKKRWAWGVSDIPLFIELFMKDPSRSFVNKFLRVARVTEDHVLWPVNWFIITTGVTISTFVNPNFQRTSIGFLLPKITSTLLSVSLIFLVVLLWIDFSQRPPKPAEVPKWKVWLAPFEFVLLPIVGFFFMALPGLDAHTRLMLGKYMEYRITEKVK